MAAVLLMEGADPIETPSQLGAWTDQGLRIVGPAWGGTRYSGGTGAPGGLSELGVQLLKAMKRKRIILDLSHMADQAVADAFSSGAVRSWRPTATPGPSCRRPADHRATAAELARRGGMIGVSFYQPHLRQTGRRPSNEWSPCGAPGPRAGGPEHVGLGTDLDGGFDSRHAPLASLSQLKDLTCASGSTSAAPRSTA